MVALSGSTKNATYPTPEKGSASIGTFKTELDQEIMQDASLEITYQFIVTNNSHLDFEIKDEALGNNAFDFQYHVEENRYYKYGDYGSATEPEVEMQPTIIIDYLDNRLNYLRSPETNAPEENDLWEREYESDGQARIKKLLFKGNSNDLYKMKIDEGKYNDYTKSGNRNATNDIQSQLKYINKHYWVLIRDLTDENMEKLKEDYTIKTEKDNSNDKVDYVSLKAKEVSDKDIKFVASKQISDTSEDTTFYNSTEIAQMHRTGGAIPEDNIPADLDPTSLGYYDKDDPSPNYQDPSGLSSWSQRYTKEFDGGWAGEVTITPPTGNTEDYNKTIKIIVVIIALSIVAIVIPIGKRRLINKKYHK